MQNIRKQIVLEIKKIVKELTRLDVDVSLDRPKDEKHGDYSSNIAMAIFSNQKSKIKNQKFSTPMDLAREIGKILNTSYLIPNTLSQAGVVAPGFINFWLSGKYLSGKLQEISDKKEEYGRDETLKGQKIIVEFTDPNPFKEFHIGHLYSNIAGESLSRLLESQGANVWRVCYQGDVGLHVAKTLYGIVKHESGIKNVEDKSLQEKAKFLGKAYSLGVKAYEEDENAKKEIETINKNIYEEDPNVMDIYKKGRKWSLEYFETIYKRLGTKFKRYYFESEAGKIGREIVRNNIDKVFKESNGAVIFPGEKYGFHTRVFINSLGLPTYEAKDLGLAPTKYKDFPYDFSIIITAHEQSDYFKVVFKALSLINPELAQKTKHIAHGVVRLPTGKMSSRTGNVITGEWLIDEAKKLIGRRYPEMKDDALEKVSIGAVKYALLKTGIGRDIEFDFNESINFEGNSGPYLQYTFARTQSVINKVKNTSQNSNLKLGLARSHLARVEVEEESILRSIDQFPEIVEEAAESFSPNLLCNYLFDLAQKFNLFYQKYKILSPVILNKVKNPSQAKEILRSTQDDMVKNFRLTLTQAVGQVIKNGLYLLGIKAPERM